MKKSKYASIRRADHNIRSFVRRRLIAGAGLAATWREAVTAFPHKCVGWNYVNLLDRQVRSELKRRPRVTVHRFARLRFAEDYVMLGWIPRPSLEGTVHGDYCVHVEWVCSCGRRPPEPARARDPVPPPR